MDNDHTDYRRGLVPLSELDDFDVADGYTDIRGFDTFTDRGDRVGEVDQLLVDPGARRVAAITIDVDRDLLDVGREPRTQVPIENVEIDTAGRRVVVQGAGVGYLGLSGLGDAVDRRDDVLDDRSTGYANTTRRDLTGSDEERIVLLAEELEIQKRRVPAGEVDIDKRVETEHVRESVPVTREKVTVERRPATDPDLGIETRFEGDEIRIPLVEEEVVVEKRAVASEELVVRKEQVQEEQVIEADLRRERAEVHHPHDAQGGTGTNRGVDADNPLRGGRDLNGDGVR